MNCRFEHKYIKYIWYWLWLWLCLDFPWTCPRTVLGLSAPSGTEPKIKTYFTTLGKDLAEAQAKKDQLAEGLKPILA